jgi:hypothetical protein
MEWGFPGKAAMCDIHRGQVAEGKWNAGTQESKAGLLRETQHHTIWRAWLYSQPPGDKSWITHQKISGA